MLAYGNVPNHLKNKVVLSFVINDLIAALDQKIAIQDFIKDIEEYGDRLIFFIDEIHTFLNVKINEIPLIDYFKPLLANGKMSLIGTTTDQDIEKTISFKDDSTQRRFETIELSELSYRDSAKVLKDSSKSFEKSFSKTLQTTFTIQPKACEKAAWLAALYFPNVSQPASAVRVLEGTAVELMNNNPGATRVEMKPIDVENYCKKNCRTGLFNRAWKVMINQYTKYSKISSVALSAFYTLFFFFGLYTQFSNWIKL